MNKKFRRMGYTFAMAMGLTLLSGCGKIKPSDMIDKYAAMCELGEYKGVEFQETKTDITDEMVQSNVESMLLNYAVSEQKTSGTVQLGDQVNIDFAGSIDGEEFEGGSSQGFTLTLGSGGMIDGFEEQIAGHDVGDTFEIEVTFPEDYGNEELNGRDAVFNITINYMVETVLPDYSDAFVASNTDASSIAEYEQGIRDEMTEYYESSDTAYNKTAIMEAVIENATIKEYPEQEMKEMIDSTVSRVQNEANEYGYDLSVWLLARYGISSEENFRNYISDLVEDFMKEKIIVCAVAKAENITVSKSEMKDYKKEMMESTGITDEDEFDEIYDYESVMYYTLADKVYDFLLENGSPVAATETDAE